jgi:hypothetical protein
VARGAEAAANRLNVTGCRMKPRWCAMRCAISGVCSDRHSCDALATEDSNVCIIRFHRLEAMCRDVKALQQHVHRLMGGEIVREAALICCSARCPPTSGRDVPA